MSKFKVGDRVRVRDDLEVGKCRGFESSMEPYRGNIYTVTTVYETGWITLNIYGSNWYFSLEMLELVPSDEIHITTDGETVHAIHKQDGKVVNRAKAVCAPCDTFDFSIGAKLAFERVLNIAPPEDKPAEPPRFDWELFRTGKQAVNCRTEHDAEVFLAWLAGRGCRWSKVSPATESTYWDRYKTRTSYVFNFQNDGHVSFNHYDFFADEGLAVIPFTREMLAEVNA